MSRCTPLSLAAPPPSPLSSLTPAWQMAPPLIIICSAFTATGLLLNGVDRLATGRNRRVRIDEFTHGMDQRDAAIEAAKPKQPGFWG